MLLGIRVALYITSVSPATASSPRAIIRRTPKNGSERHQIAASDQKVPAAVKQPTFTHLANFQFTASSTIPTVGRITSKTNSKHNWKFNAGNPTLRSLVNITQATQPFATRIQARRKILFATLVESTEDPTSIDDNGFCLFTSLLSIGSSTPSSNAHRNHHYLSAMPKAAPRLFALFPRREWAEVLWFSGGRTLKHTVFWSKDTLRVLRCVGKGEHRNIRSVHP